MHEYTTLKVYPFLFAFNNSCYLVCGPAESALVWHTRGRVFEPRLQQRVLRFVGRVYTVQYVELKGTAHEGGG